MAGARCSVHESLHSLCELRTRHFVHMKPQDPCYPLFPIAAITCAAAIALLFATSFCRQRCNIGLLLLCFYLLIDNLFKGANAIIWARSWDVKLPVYCDIGASSP